MNNGSNPQIIITGYLTSPPQHPPPLPLKSHASICYDEYDLAGGFEEIKNLVKSIFKKDGKMCEKNQYHIKLTISNIDEVIAFAERINDIPECQKLTPDQRLKIIMSYPFILKTF